MNNGYHSICSRVGSINPKLAEKLIIEFSDVGNVIFDPFSGKGTIPFISLLHKRHAIGNDLSPEAYILTRSKVRFVDIKQALTVLKKIKSSYNEKEILCDVVPEDVGIFYSNTTLKQILYLRQFLIYDDLNEIKKDTHIFLLSIILGLLHGNSSNHFSVRCSHSFSMSPNYVKNYIKEKKWIPPEINTFEAIERVLLRLKDEKKPEINGKAYMEDARDLTEIKEDSIDVIITSPPYLDTLTYAWDNWLRLWFLGYNYKEIRNKLIETGSVSNYYSKMFDVFTELYRVLKKNCTLVLILGKTRNEKDIISVIKQIAQESSFKLKKEWSDKIVSGRKCLTCVNGINGGISKEQILIFKK